MYLYRSYIQGGWVVGGFKNKAKLVQIEINLPEKTELGKSIM